MEAESTVRDIAPASLGGTLADPAVQDAFGPVIQGPVVGNISVSNQSSVHLGPKVYKVTQHVTHNEVVKAEKPLLMLIKLLVNFVENEEKTVLTNSQLMNILGKEFDIDIWNLPTLAVEIYMNVLKKFLKDWPRWDTVDNIFRCSKVDKSIDMESIWQKEYVSLKLYLKEMLELSREPTEATMKKITTTCTVTNESRAVLEVQCSRQQLDRLFFRQPDYKQQMTIFNSNLTPKYGKIRLLNIDLSQICYWPGVAIDIDLAKTFQYTRINELSLKHTLVNHKLGDLPAPPSVSRYVHCRSKNKTNTRSEVPYETVNNFLDYLLDILKNLQYKSEPSEALKIILEIVKTDLTHCPQLVDRASEYMYFMNAHPYVRHLFQDKGHEPITKITPQELQEMDKYDLELLEYISPSIIFNINTSLRMRADGTIPDASGQELLISMMQGNEQWLQFRCIYCGFKFYGLRSVSTLRLHIREIHCDEPDAACSHCNRSFSIPELTRMRWFHKC